MASVTIPPDVGQGPAAVPAGARMHARLPALPLILALGDAACALVALAASRAAVALAWDLHEGWLEPWKVALQATFLVGLTLASQHAHDLYRSPAVRGAREYGVRLAVAAASVVFVAGFIAYLVPSLDLGRRGLAVFASHLLPSLVAWRLALLALGEDRRAPERVLLVGGEEPMRAVAGAIESRLRGAWEVAGTVDLDRAADVPDLCSLARAQAIDRIVVLPARDPDRLPIDPLLASKLDGLEVESGVVLYERLTGKVLLGTARPSWILFADALERHDLFRRLREAGNSAGALLALVALSPLLLLLAAAVRLTSRGPVFYSQERVGEKGRVFRLYKFRTMRDGAEAGTGPVWASAGDPRVTPLGRLMRLTRLDELPQLANVLLGDMCFVGPRPERPHFVERLAREIPYYGLRHSVRPGVTGWAQINYTYAASVEDAHEKLLYDLYYIRNASALLDIEIVLGTVAVLLTGRGAR